MGLEYIPGQKLVSTAVLNLKTSDGKFGGIFDSGTLFLILDQNPEGGWNAIVFDTYPEVDAVVHLPENILEKLDIPPEE